MAAVGAAGCIDAAGLAAAKQASRAEEHGIAPGIEGHKITGFPVHCRLPASPDKKNGSSIVGVHVWKADGPSAAMWASSQVQLPQCNHQAPMLSFSTFEIYSFSTCWPALKNSPPLKPRHSQALRASRPPFAADLFNRHRRFSVG
jgi:hypothetical protein